MSHDLTNWDESSIRVVMAGTGNPYHYLTPFRKQLIWAIHHDGRKSVLVRQFDISIEKLENETAPLIQATLVQERNGEYEVVFFVANEIETATVAMHAKQMGVLLADYCERGWPRFQQIYAELGLALDRSFADLAFFLVGDRVLDVGMLDALARDHSLMPSAPARPSPDMPNASYYFWMIKGTYEQIGHYGQRFTPLPEPDWYLLTFGQYEVNRYPNLPRTQFEQAVCSRVDGVKTCDMTAFADGFGMPTFALTQSEHWTIQTRIETDGLCEIYKNHRVEIEELFNGLNSGKRRPESFGEFFCWYHHVAYAHAIDLLAERGLLQIPYQRYTAAIWCEDGTKNSF